MNYSFEYIDIILLAMIAGFIFLRLRGILGKRTGFEGKAPGQFPGWGAFRPGSCSCRRSAFAWPHRHRPQALFSPHSCRLQGDMESAFHVARDVHINLKVRRMAVELGEHGVTLV